MPSFMKLQASLANGRKDFHLLLDFPQGAKYLSTCEYKSPFIDQSSSLQIRWEPDHVWGRRPKVNSHCALIASLSMGKFQQFLNCIPVFFHCVSSLYFMVVFHRCVSQLCFATTKSRFSLCSYRQFVNGQILTVSQLYSCIFPLCFVFVFLDCISPLYFATIQSSVLLSPVCQWTLNRV